jgi:redox-sensitive bicupin YhaK (pirin superfamily)
VPEGFNGFVFVYRGAISVGGEQVQAGKMAILANDGDGVVLRAAGAARVLLVAGKPLGEPIAQYGPFVMNTQAELQQAFLDYQAGKFMDAEVRKV